MTAVSGVLAATLALFFAIGHSVAQDVRNDAVFRVTFAGASPNDVTANGSTATVVSNVTFTTSVPVMANGTGNGAVFDGSNSFLSYGLGANNILQIQGPLTYHARVEYGTNGYTSTNGFAAGQVEQWIMGRFETASDANARVTEIDTPGASIGQTMLFPYGACSDDGVNWDGGAGLIQSTNGLAPGVFYDLFLRYDGASVYFDIFNAQTGARVAGPGRMGNVLSSLFASPATFDVGARTAPDNVFLNGVIEQLNVWNRPLADDEIQAVSSDPGFVSFGLTHKLISDLQPTNYSDYLPAGTAIQFTSISTIGVATNAIRLVLNGADVSDQLNITGESTNWAASFTGLVANQIYQAAITVTDLDGNTKSQTLHFNTFSTGIHFVEAEDYDFGGGQFIDNVVLSSSPGPSNYLDRLSVAEVDRHSLVTNTGNQYRTGDPVGVTFADDSPQRQEFVAAEALDPGVADYAVEGMLDGEWLNYTRTFSTNQYWVYARIMSQWRGTFDMGLSVGPNSSPTPVGEFVGTGVPLTGGYSLVPLTDVTGTTPVPLSLGGVETLKLTCLHGGLGDPSCVSNNNYFLLVPATSSVPPGPPVVYGTPVVLSLLPANGAVNVPTNEQLTVTILNQITHVVPSTVRVLVNNLDVTSHAVLTPTADGLTVTFLPATGWPQGLVVLSAALMYQDDAAPANSASNLWQFTTVSTPYVPTGNTPAPYTNGLVFRVNFTNGNPNDISTPYASVATVVSNITYDTNLPPMANSSGWAAIFNGAASPASSWISYGQGTSNCLSITNSLTYHVRAEFYSWNAAEQWLAGRFRSTDQGSSTRVSVLHAPANSGTTPAVEGLIYSDGADGNLADVTGLSLGVFYDAWLRFSPGTETVDVFDAQTGLRLKTETTKVVTNMFLTSADTPFDVGQRTTPANVPLNGEIAEVAVWNRVLTTTEITNISYGSASAAPPPPGVGIQYLRVLQPGVLSLDFSTPNTFGAFTLEQAASLTGSSWNAVSEVTFTLAQNGDIVAQFPAPLTTTFYRVHSQ
jgi:hypothetical protein